MNHLIILIGIPAILVFAFLAGVISAPNHLIAITNGLGIGLGCYFLFSSAVKA